MIPAKISRIREKQTRYLSQAIQLEEAVNPHIVRATMSLVSMAVVVFVAWAAFTNINEVARTPGEVVPKGFQQTVQHLDGGLVKAIYVHEGQIVKAGDVLLKIESAGVLEDLEKTRSKQIALEMQEERLRAFTEGREPDFKKFGSSAASLQKDQMAFFEGMKAARDKEKQIIIDQVTQKEQREIISADQNRQKNDAQKEQEILACENLMQTLGTTSYNEISKIRADRDDIRILIIEDDSLSRMMIKNVLMSDFTVHVAVNAAEAIPIYLETAPDIVFLDIGLPDINGHTLLSGLLQIDPEAYIIMFSGRKDQESVLQALNKGALGFVGKPFTRGKLYQYIEQCPTVQQKKSRRKNPQNRAL